MKVQTKTTKKAYVCTNCDHHSIKWVGCCPQCNEWNSIIEQMPQTTHRAAHAPTAVLRTLDAVELSEGERMVSGISEWDRVLGGGILPGSFLILTGDPGIGKSTLLLQVSNALAQKYSVLYFSSEESLTQVKQRAARLACANPMHFSDHTSLESLIATASKHKPNLIILDSIQNCHFSNVHTIPGTVGQLREAGFHLMKCAKENNITILVTGHITKNGAMAGPKLLEHMVDGVFYLHSEDQLQTRILRSVKNRFGTINEIGFFEMHEDGMRAVDNVNKQLLGEFSADCGAALISTLEGSRPILCELQALCITSKFGIPQRVVTGTDPKRIVLIAAILEKYLKVSLSSFDIFFKIAGGTPRLKDSSSDLGIALALLSSYFQQPLPKNSLAMAEISLTGHIKASAHAQQCAREVEKFGIATLFLARGHKVTTRCNIVQLQHVYELLGLFPEKK